MTYRFAYIPWIKAHGDRLVKQLEVPGELEFVPLHLFDQDRPEQRHWTYSFAQRRPKLFAISLEKRLLAIKQPLNGLLLSLDWAPPMQIAVEVARKHNLPTILVPHESVFMDEDLYYTNPLNGHNVPTSDLVLTWGNLQRDIFINRGFPDEQIKLVGSPKLDSYQGFKPKFSRAEFLKWHGLNGNQPLVLFAAQPLDNVANKPLSRKQQFQALCDLVNIAGKQNFQVMLRLPPANLPEIMDELIDKQFSNKLPFLRTESGGSEAFLDPTEVLYHADLVVSVSSTMLMEAALLNRPSLALGYVDEKSLFERFGGLPMAGDRSSLEKQLGSLIGQKKHSFTKEGWAWMEHSFSTGRLSDTGAIKRIRETLQTHKKSVRLVDHESYFKPGLFSMLRDPLPIYHRLMGTLGVPGLMYAFGMARKKMGLYHLDMIKPAPANTQKKDNGTDKDITL